MAWLCWRRVALGCPCMIRVSGCNLATLPIAVLLQMAVRPLERRLRLEAKSQCHNLCSLWKEHLVSILLLGCKWCNLEPTSGVGGTPPSFSLLAMPWEAHPIQSQKRTIFHLWWTWNSLKGKMGFNCVFTGTLKRLKYRMPRDLQWTCFRHPNK